MMFQLASMILCFQGFQLRIHPAKVLHLQQQYHNHTPNVTIVVIRAVTPAEAGDNNDV